MQQKITPESHEHWLQMRSEVITSTDCSALFGLSKYKTLFELWHEKKNKVVYSIEENERMKWGSRLEPIIAKGVAEDRGWKVKPNKDFYRLTYLKAGSSFDFQTDDEALVEIKNVDSLVFKNEWTDDEAPPHIELQVQHQLMVSGFKKAYIVALIGGNQVHVIERSKDDGIVKVIETKILEFWKSIEENNPPKPNYEADAEYIISMHSFAEPGKVYSGDVAEIEKLVLEYKEAGDLEKQAGTKKKSIKAQIMEMIGDSEKVKASTFSISAGIVGAKNVQYQTEPYRDFRIFLKKGKENESSTNNN